MGGILTLDGDAAHHKPNRALFQRFMSQRSSPASDTAPVFNRI
jgi:hypothetical protein